MTQKLFYGVAAAAIMIIAAACNENKPAASDLSIVPAPTELKLSGKTVAVPETIGISAVDDSLKALADTYIGQMSSGAEAVLPLKSSSSEAFIRLGFDRKLSSEEYRLTVRKNGIRITGGSTKGVWWGLQTLSQILMQAENGCIPAVRIADKPHFAYRGAHLDCCRHFFTVDEVKRYIDILALHKLNTFHWHLTDDQGWRIQILGYPKLTDVGSVRKETLVGLYGESDEYDGQPYGGFYTQDEIREVVRYAGDRQITVIPEIEMPGHAVAALTSYPELGCKGKGYEVRTTWGISEDLFCVGKESTFVFLENVLSEVCDLFPGEYIHIGGDECPMTVWEKCPHCLAVMEREGYSDIRQLQGYLLHRIETFLAGKGKKIIGWDEILDGGVTPTAVVMSWRGPAGGIKAAKQGNHVIMAPNNYSYLDYAQTADPEGNGEPLGIGGHVSLRIMHSFDPYDELSEPEKQYILGLQCNLWAEYISDFSHVQFMVLPRFCALSENAWSEGKTDYDSFLRRVEKGMLPLYRYFGFNVADYAFNGIE